ncbi:AP-3 complex subunit delta [Massospora cicadina]|nr:AP-3 complex subunit delta [Massospora cicadina]
MFERSLLEMIRGLRACKQNEQDHIAKCIDEIRNELKTDDMEIKTMAISKLNYLQMLGYDFSWAAFHVVEVMSSSNLAQKRVGYLAAGQCFRQDTEVLMLVTNLVKKDLGSSSAADVEVALEGVSQFMTPDLAQFLCQDILNLLSHSQACVRKRATLTLFKVFLRFPEGVRLCYPRLKELLDDPDSSVANAAVHVICELARKAPESYLPLVPTFYRLLEGPYNCWMFIKLTKLFGVLTPLEPRLIKKMSGPFQKLIDTTAANSLLAELLNTAVVGGYLISTEETSAAMAKSCVLKLGQLLEDSDQNLKYVALVILGRLLPLRPDLAASLTRKVLVCLDDFDYSVRVRALELASQMVVQKDLILTVNRLVGQLVGDPLNFAPSGTGHVLPARAPVAEEPAFIAEGAFRRLLVKSIVEMCSRDKYCNVPDFEWYVATLIDLVYVSRVDVAELIGEQLLNVAVRVQSVRNYSLQGVVRLISDTTLLLDASLPESNAEVLESAALIAGEYAASLTLTELSLLLPRFYAREILHLTPQTQAAYIHAGLKVLVALGRLMRSAEEWLQAINAFANGLLPFTHSPDTDLQERACNTLRLVQLAASQLDEHPDQKQSLVEELAVLFGSYELNAVAAKAQSKVVAPPELDFNAWIHEPPPKVAEASPIDTPSVTNVEGDSLAQNEETKKRKARRQRQRRDDPFYIATRSDSEETPLPEVDSIPIVRLDKTSIVGLESLRLAKDLSRKLRSKGRGGEKVVVADGEMPDGAASSEDETLKPAPAARGLLESEATALVGLDLTKPLEAGEALPQIRAYLRPDQVLAQQQQMSWQANEKKPKRKTKSKAKRRPKSKEVTEALIDLETVQPRAPVTPADELANLLAFDPREWGNKRKALLVDSDAVQLGVMFSGAKASFFVVNPHPNQRLLNCELVFVDTSALLVEGLDAWNTVKLAECVASGESHESNNALTFSPADQGHLKDGIRIEGLLAYVQSEVLTRTSVNFRLTIPALAWMVASPPRLTPDEFSDLIASHLEIFQVAHRVDACKPLTSPISRDNARRLFDAMLPHLADNVLGMGIVQLIPGVAASLYGAATSGQRVVALARLHPNAAPTTTQLPFSVEFKSHSDDLLVALSRDLLAAVEN